MVPVCVLFVLALAVSPALPSNQRGERVCTTCGLVIQHITSATRNLKNTVLSPALSTKAILTEIIEDVCMHISRYGVGTGPDGAVSFIPAFDESGEAIEHRNFEFNREVSALHEHYCVDIVDSNFDELVGLFTSVSLDVVDKQEREFKNTFCTEITNYC